MSGELLIKTKNWRQILPALLLSCALTLAAALACLRYLPIQAGAAWSAGAALLGYVLFRALYPAICGMFPQRGAAGTWTVTEEDLDLNGTRIPRSTIRQIYCWPNRNALGQTGTGWIVNIETDRGHHVLRSLTAGEDAERSVRQLRAMVTALGYESSWREF